MSRLIAVAYAGSDPTGSALGTLTEATSRQLRIEANATGGGQLAISTLSDQAAWAVEDNWVAFWRDTVSGDPLGGFWVRGATETLVSPDEQGGLIRTISGPGPIDCLREALVWHRAVAAGDGHIQRARGRWHWDDLQPARALIRMLVEAQARGCIPFVTWDFTGSVDSDGDDWDPDLKGRINFDIGITLLRAVEHVRNRDLTIEMTADFVLHAWPGERGTDLSGSVSFTAGVNIRDTSDREQQARAIASHALVGGTTEDGDHRYRPSHDASIVTTLGRRVERFSEHEGSARPAVLRRVGLRKLRRWLRQHDGPITIGVIETVAQVSLTDYAPGDTVLVVTPAVTLAPRLVAVTLADRDDGAGEYDPILDFGDLGADGGEDVGDDGGGKGRASGDGGPRGTGYMQTWDVEDWARTVGPVAGNPGPDIGSIPVHSGDGAPFDGGNTWDIQDQNDITIELDGTQLIVDFASPARQFNGTLPAPPALPADGIYRFAVQTDALRTGSGVQLYLFDDENYQVVVAARFGLGDLYVAVQPPGAGVSSDTFSFTFATGTLYHVAWDVSQPGVSRARIWEDGDPEPTDWQASVETTADEIEPGYLGLVVDGGNGGAQETLVKPITYSAFVSGERRKWALVATLDGATTTFSVGEPFVESSLQVKITGLLVEPASMDGDAGEFTLDDPGTAGASLWASWDPD